MNPQPINQRPPGVFCPHCRGENDPSSATCQWCGRPIAPARSRSGIIVLAVVALAVLGFIVLGPKLLGGGAGSTVAGAGTITFATGINMATLELVGPQQSSFSSSDTFAWRAVLSEPANAASLRWVVAKLNGSTEVTQIDQPVSISNPTFNIFGNSAAMSDFSLLLDGPGTYVMRYMRDATVLAEGRFTLR